MGDIKLPEPYYGIARRDGGADIAGPWVSIEQLHAYAEARAKQAAELEREACAQRVHALIESHCSDTQKSADPRSHCFPDAGSCEIVAAWCTAIDAIRGTK